MEQVRESIQNETMPEEGHGGNNNQPDLAARPRRAKPELHMCPMDGIYFNQRAHLYDHIRSHTREKPFVCLKCDKWFASKKRLKTHSGCRPQKGRKTISGVTATRYRCLDCDHKCANQKEFFFHRLQHHATRPHPSRTCSQCGFTASTKKALNSHKSYPSQSRLHYKCDDCCASFQTWNSLCSHAVSAHSGAFKCPGCGHNTGNRRAFSRHIVSCGATGTMHIDMNFRIQKMQWTLADLKMRHKNRPLNGASAQGTSAFFRSRPKAVPMSSKQLVTLSKVPTEALRGESATTGSAQGPCMRNSKDVSASAVKEPETDSKKSASRSANTNDTATINIKTATSTIKARRSIMKDMCPAMFRGVPPEKPLETVDASEFQDDVVKALLQYILTDETDLINDFAKLPDLLQIARKYEQKELEEACLSAFRKNFKPTVDEVLGSLIFAHKAQLEDIEGQCLEYISGNKQAVKLSMSYTRLIQSQDAPVLADIFFSMWT